MGKLDASLVHYYLKGKEMRLEAAAFQSKACYSVAAPVVN